MLYTLNLDKDNFVVSIAHTKNDSVEIDVSSIDMNHLSAYKLVGSDLVLDEERLAQIVEEEENRSKELEIEELKRKLTATDYIMAETFESIMSLNSSVTFIVDFIKILGDFKQKYSEAIANRKAWRQRIEELSK